MKKVCVVSGEEHDSGAVDERHDPIAKVEPVQPRQALILQFQVHHNDIEHIPDGEGNQEVYEHVLVLIAEILGQQSPHGKRGRAHRA